jgi:hypothetical protein
MGKLILSPEIRFWSRVKQAGSDECWEWTAAKHKFGYGMLGVDNKVVYAHRFSWELHFGIIPDGLEVLHSCDNPPCCNPRHLFLGTQRDNVVDMGNKNRRNGGSMPGEAHPQAKLTLEKIRIIRMQYAQGGISQRKMARLYNVCQTTIADIVLNKSWIE